MKRSPGFTAGLVAVFVSGLVLVLLPILALIFGEVSALTPNVATSPESLWASFTEPHLRALLFGSITLALGVTLGALCIGVPIGLLLASSRDRLLRVLFLAHLLPLCLPPYLGALGWAGIVSRTTLGENAGTWMSGLLYSKAGFVFVMTIALSPLVSILTWAFARSIDASVIEVARLNRKPNSVLTRVVLPLCMPGIALGGLLVFVLALGEVAVPQLLRVPVYASTVFSRLADFSFLPGEALARAWPLIFVAIAVAAACYLTEHKGHAALGLRDGSASDWMRGRQRNAAIACLSVAASLSALPIGILLGRGFFAQSGGVEGMAAAGHALANSLLYATLAATFMLLIAVPAGFLWSRRPKAGHLLSLPLLVGLVLPAVVLGLGLVIAWNQPATQWIYQGTGIVLLGLLARYLYPIVRAAKLGFDRLPKTWLEAARIHQGSWWRRLAFVILPASLPIVATAWTLAFLLVLRDMDTSIIFYPPGGESLPVRALTLEANAPPGLTAASASLQVMVTALALILLTASGRLSRRLR
ncbi:MAG: iron ABC transporter permease [Deltaproteobacteria bacterium]|nr:iron ABC transporter permease [Deltaproteobacteria bacterium]